MSKNEDFENMVKSLQQKIYQDEEKTYSKKVIEEYRNPHNFGFIKNPDASGKIKGSCGDTMKIDIKIRDKKIIDARFWTDGCGASIACGNMLSKMIKGKTPKEAKNIKSSDLIRALDTIPKEHEHCAKLAVDTLYICLEKFDELKNMKTVYGPVSSWRLGSSLGIDLICSKKKICSFDCIYCQLGKESDKSTHRKNFISIKEMKEEVSEVLQQITPDVITFSGMGEPTLAKNMDLAIDAIRELTDLPLAVLTNSSLLKDENVRKTLSKLDLVVAKIDASNEELFQKINQPAEGITFKSTVDGIKKFKKIFTGKLAIQTMFMKENIEYADEIAKIVSKIKPDEVQINTPLRPCSIKPLTEKQLTNIEKNFKDKGLKTISVYQSTKPKTSPLDKMDLLKRRKSIL